MGFFKDFREDLSQAVNELLPEETAEPDSMDMDDQIVNTLDTEDFVSEEKAGDEKIKELLKEFTQDEETDNADSIGTRLEEENDIDMDKNQKDTERREGESMEDNVDLELLEAMNAEESEEKETEKNEQEESKLRAASVANDDEVTIISKGTVINGSITSDGSLEINGNITGDIDCLGKLTITGKIVGNSSAAEVFVNTERMEGSITSEGTVKIGLGTVVIGDIVATSGVIAGAVKGEIDVNGPIVIDSTAIIKGNIKAKSVQINNGAIVEGFCSLSYSSIDVDNIFE